MLHVDVHTITYIRIYVCMHICIYALSLSPLFISYIYLHIYAYMPFIYINSERRYYTLFLPSLFLLKKKTLELFQFNYTCIECVILYNYKSMSYLHEKIQFSLLFLLRYFFVCFLLDLIKVITLSLLTMSQNLSILILLFFFF